MSETVQMTRYERVQEILDRAAGSSAADYGGRGRFWHLPLTQLLEVVIHGVRMLAPAGEVKAACCHGESAEAGERQPRYPAAAPASGLDRGLRGQPPTWPSPWQADFNECSTQVIDVTYEGWNDIYPDSDHDGLMKRQQRVRETLWWPAHRPLQTFELLSISGKPNLPGATGPRASRRPTPAISRWSSSGGG